MPFFAAIGVLFSVLTGPIGSQPLSTAIPKNTIEMEARYVFVATVRLSPERLQVDPDRIDVRIAWPAAEPETPGWMFFRDNLWRGELNDPSHVRSLVAADLDVDVSDLEFRAFEVDQEYLEAFRAAIADDLDAFRADDVDEVLNKYLGSRLEVQR